MKEDVSPRDAPSGRRFGTSSPLRTRGRRTPPLSGLLLLLSLGFWGGPLVSCGKKTSLPVPPAPPAPASTPPPSEPPLPPPANVKFPDWNEAEDETFLELPKPAELAPPRWNFGKGERFGYEVTQTTHQKMETRTGGKVGTLQARDRNRGTFEFIAGKDRTALVFLKFHTEESFRDGVQVPRAEIEKTPATQFDAIAKEDGTAEIMKPPGRTDATFFFDAFLALGDGRRTLKDGWVQTRASGFAKVGRFECVRLESEFEFAPSAEFGNTLQRGRTVAWFAPRERRFVRASTAVATSTRTRAQGRDGAWTVTLVDSMTTLRARLLDPP